MSKRCDHLIDYMNGHLSEEEKQAFEVHLETCSDCQEELNELKELTSDLGFLSEPIDPPPSMKERVLSAAFEEKAPTEPEKVSEPVEFKPKKKNRWIMPTMAAALMLSLVGNAFLFTELASSPEEGEEIPSVSIDSLVQQLSLQPSAEDIPFEARASFVDKDQHQQLIVEADQLSQPADTEVYQVWLLKDEEPYRAGTFTPGEDGSGMSTFDIDPEMGFDTIAITIEPDETSEQPEGEIVLLQEL
ncbi:hypothetical protein JCM19037_401 [Geomicrobium sp. JCM 19037]|uniref:anti-sigma factor n=1 Tax=unclassified Geomicrobium TaxID=2628951 RepID=UPI00045F2FCB|nr:MULTISPECIES: anti-sigma factor [unclassified Geomicrobium]GAK02184.1 hypothetical protein JCM19037_401 [Geomicrobium sp. JCM 19037]GAK14136.1 hypothetical protein JCM19039_4033 [Geomicrobium sp. JCM 19039]